MGTEILFISDTDVHGKSEQPCRFSWMKKRVCVVLMRYEIRETLASLTSIRGEMENLERTDTI